MGQADDTLTMFLIFSVASGGRIPVDIDVRIHGGTHMHIAAAPGHHSGIAIATLSCGQPNKPAPIWARGAEVIEEHAGPQWVTEP